MEGRSAAAAERRMLATHIADLLLANYFVVQRRKLGAPLGLAQLRLENARRGLPVPPIPSHAIIGPSANLGKPNRSVRAYCVHRALGSRR